MLAVVLHIDLLTAYLTTSPGGVDAAAITGASTKVDSPLVMALQTVKVIVLLIIGTHVARRMAPMLKPAAPDSEPVGPLDFAISIEFVRFAVLDAIATPNTCRGLFRANHRP